MALHQFKTKHNSGSANKVCLKNTPQRQQNSDDELQLYSRNPSNNTLRKSTDNSISAPRKRPSDPILLYRPAGSPYRPVLPLVGQEDLFSACHKDLIEETEMIDNQTQRFDEVDDSRYTQPGYGGLTIQRIETPQVASIGDSSHLIACKSSRMPKSTPSLSWSVRKKEYAMRAVSKKTSNMNPTRNTTFAYRPWDNTPSEPIYKDSEEMTGFQNLPSQVAFARPSSLSPSSSSSSSSSASPKSPFVSQQSPMHIDRRIHHFRELLQVAQRPPQETFQAEAIGPQPSFHGFDNTQRMLAEGVRQVCEEARDTKSRMLNETKWEGNDFQYPDDICSSISSDGSHGDASDKLNFIQAAILQLADCNDPDILEEARRIIPVPLLERLLKQLQEDPHRIT